MLDHERAFLSLIKKLFKDKKGKVALIGEYKDNTSLKLELEKLGFSVQNFWTLTDIPHPFVMEDGENFDFLFGVRSCEAEHLILDAAEKYHKPFAIMLCGCKNSGENKVPNGQSKFGFFTNKYNRRIQYILMSEKDTCWWYFLANLGGKISNVY